MTLASAPLYTSSIDTHLIVTCQPKVLVNFHPCVCIQLWFIICKRISVYVQLLKVEGHVHTEPAFSVLGCLSGEGLTGETGHSRVQWASLKWLVRGIQMSEGHGISTSYRYTYHLHHRYFRMRLRFF